MYLKSWKNFATLFAATLFLHSSLVVSSNWRWNPQSTEPVQSHIKVYLFNVLNPVEALAGQKLSVRQVGPYVYKETTERVNIIVDAKDGTVKYQEKRTYNFLPELSKGNEDDVINFVNVPFGSSMGTLLNVGWLGQGMITTVLKSGEQLVQQSLRVRDILYDGIDATVYTQLMNSSGDTPPPQFQGGKFGLFRGRNGTPESEIQVSNHASYMQNIGEVVSWKGQKQLKFWADDSKCNKIQGTDGTVFPPEIKKTDTLHFFNPEACRSLPLVFQKEVQIGSINAYRFTFPKSMIEDARKNPDNACYCRGYDDFDKEMDKCLKRGALDLAPCRKQAPLVSTFPHFMDADPAYVEGVAGLQADPELHSSYVDIDPVTGTVLDSSLKFQLNIDIAQIKEISSLNALPEYLFPVMWIDKTYRIQEEALNKLVLDRADPSIVSDLEENTNIISNAAYTISSSIIPALVAFAYALYGNIRS